MRLFTIVLMILSIQFGFSTPQKINNQNVNHSWDIFLTEEKDSLLSLDIYWNSKSKDANVLLFAHGGGWLSGEKKEYREMAYNLADNGITVVLTNYHLSPSVKFPVHIHDVASAINWAYQFIDKYNGDKESIYLMWHSAGGHLISLLLCDEKYLGKYKITPNDIAGAIMISGVFEIKPQEGGATKEYLGMVFGDNEMICKAASCKNHIDSTNKKRIPRFMIAWCSEENKLIVNESKNPMKELKSSQIEYQSYIFKGKDHYAFKNDLSNVNSVFFNKMMLFMAKK